MPKTSSPQSASPSASSQQRVLIVEDDVFLRQLLVVKFNKEGYAVREASDGREALEQIAKELPHAVILDLLMPEVNGFQVLEALRADARTKDLPVVVLTNLGEQEHIERVKALGADDYLIKAHLFLDEIVARISEIIKKRYL